MPLVSPLAGIVTERRANPGMEARPDLADPLFVVSDLSSLQVAIDLPESALSKLSAAATGGDRGGRLPGTDFPRPPGARFPRSVDASLRRIQARAGVENADGLLRPEMYARVTLLPGEDRNAVRVPNGALVTEGLQHFVFVEREPGRAGAPQGRARAAGPRVQLCRGGPGAQRARGEQRRAAAAVGTGRGALDAGAVSRLRARPAPVRARADGRPGGFRRACARQPADRGLPGRPGRPGPGGHPVPRAGAGGSGAGDQPADRARNGRRAAPDPTALGLDHGAVGGDADLRRPHRRLFRTPAGAGEAAGGGSARRRAACARTL